jgi:hypothetical protein
MGLITFLVGNKMTFSWWSLYIPRLTMYAGFAEADYVGLNLSEK